MEWPFTGAVPRLPDQPQWLGEPTSVVAGETLYFQRNIPQCPAAGGWSLTYSFSSASGSPISFSASVENGIFVVRVQPTETAGWIPAIYRGMGFCVNAAGDLTASPIILPGQTVCVFDGYLEVKRNISRDVDGAVVDNRSSWERIRDNCLAVLEGKAKNDLLDSSIGNTTFRRMTHEQVIKLYDRAQEECLRLKAEARIKQGFESGNNILVKFVNPL